jgi:hypothetical protein
MIVCEPSDGENGAVTNVYASAGSTSKFLLATSSCTSINAYLNQMIKLDCNRHAAFSYSRIHKYGL